MASKLDIKRIGFAHQAGSDSHLTMDVYLELLKETYLS